MPLTKHDALNLASPTKTPLQWEAISPRWLLSLLPWVQVPAGVYRVNRVAEPPTVKAEHLEPKKGELLPEGSAAYETVRSVLSEPAAVAAEDPVPAVYHLAKVETVVKMHTFVEDLYSHPHDQEEEQLRIAVAAIKEEKERRILTSAKFGLLNAAAPKMRIATDSGPPTPDDFDRLLALVWKKPAFFLAHPRAVAAFGRECTARGVTPETVEILGSPFVAWRGVPVVPSDKLPIAEGKDGSQTSILLLRVGEGEQGVVGLHQAGVGDENLQSLRVRRMRVDDDGVASYLLTCYFGVAVLIDDALGVLEKVRV
jgi:hypothetical protein